jgi:hypothetical protein
MDIVLQPVGQVRSAEKGPREDDWGGIVSEIHLDESKFASEARADRFLACRSLVLFSRSE